MTFLVGCLIEYRDICKMILNPKTKRPVSINTLQLHFRGELDKGLMQVKTRHHAALFKNVEAGNVTAQIWWDKTRNGIREEGMLVLPGAPTEEREGEESISHAARVVAFTLAMGVAQAEQGPKKKIKEKS